MYNFRLKSYGNGTAQLTYFHKPIVTKDDTYRRMPATNLDLMTDEGYEKFLKRKNNFEDDCSFRFVHETFLDYLDEFEVVKGVYPGEYEYESPFGDYIPDSHLPYLEVKKELTPEELAEKRERSILSSMNRSKKKIYDYGRSNVWDWFFTLTFERVEEFNAENFEECKKKVSKWFHNLRLRHCPNIKYLAIPEQHESGAWHFHCLVSNCDELEFEVAKNNQRYLKDKKTKEYILDEKGARVPNKYYGQELRTSYPDGNYIYNIKQYKNGFSTATRITDTKKAVSYVIKYVTKEVVECGFGKRRYLPSNNLELPVETYTLLDFRELQGLITDIEYKFGVKLSIDQIKTYSVDVENYNNTVTMFEFDTPVDGAVDDSERIAIRLNELMEEWYE